MDYDPCSNDARQADAKSSGHVTACISRIPITSEAVPLTMSIAECVGQKLPSVRRMPSNRSHQPQQNGNWTLTGRTAPAFTASPFVYQSCGLGSGVRPTHFFILPHHLSIPFVRLVRVKSSSLQGLPTCIRNPVSHRRAAVVVFDFNEPPMGRSDRGPLRFRRRQFCGAASLLRCTRCVQGGDTTRRFRHNGGCLIRCEAWPTDFRLEGLPSLRFRASHALKALNCHCQPFLGWVTCKFYCFHAPNIRFPDHIARKIFRSKTLISRTLRFQRDFLCDLFPVPDDFLPCFPLPSHVRRAVRPSVPRARESRRPGFPLPGECVPPALRAALITDAHRVDLVVVIAPRPVELLHRL